MLTPVIYRTESVDVDFSCSSMKRLLEAQIYREPSKDDLTEQKSSTSLKLTRRAKSENRKDWSSEADVRGFPAGIE